jgi:hypothetical protein
MRHNRTVCESGRRPNDRRLRELLARLEALGTAAFEADPRWQRKPRAATSDTGQDST